MSAEWVVERGIGEDRAALIDDGTLRAVRIDPFDGRLRLGERVAGRRTDDDAPPELAAAVADDGRPLLIRGPVAPQGGRLVARVVREAGVERGRAKRAIAVMTDEPPGPAPCLADKLAAGDHPVRELRSHEADELEAADWSEALEEATTGELVRPGCTLRVHLTPAMTLIDVDGTGPADALALTGAEAAAGAIRLFDLGGSIGLDLPTPGSRAARQAVDAALERALPRPFERTATNGFGFVQIVRPRPRASLPEIIAADPVGHELRRRLRRAEREPVAPLTLALPPAEAARLAAEPGWLRELERRRGGAVTVVAGSPR